MTKVPSLGYEQVIRALRRDGWVIVRQRGSHIRRDLRRHDCENVPPVGREKHQPRTAGRKHEHRHERALAKKRFDVAPRNYVDAQRASASRLLDEA